MLPCPIPNCGYKNEIDATVCAKCGEDLSSFSKLYFLPAYHYNQGLKAAQNEEFEEAIKNLQVSVSLDPSDVDTLILLGKVSAIKGDYKSAMGYWQQVLENNPNNTESIRGIEKAVKILDETLPEKPIEFPELKDLLSQLKAFRGIQEEQNKQLKEIGEQIQGREKVDEDIKQQNQRLAKMQRWLRISSIAACMLIVLSAIFLWKNLKDQSQRIADIQEEQVSITASIKKLPDQMESISAKSEELAKQASKNYLTVQQGLVKTSDKAETLDKQLRNLQNQVKELSINLSILQKQISEAKKYQPGSGKEERGETPK